MINAWAFIYKNMQVPNFPKYSCCVSIFIVGNVLGFQLSILPVEPVQIISYFKKDFQESDVQFFYLTQKPTERNSERYELNIPVTPIPKSNFKNWDPKRKTMYIIHGWLNDRHSAFITDVAVAVQEKAEWNIIVVDWGTGANKFYTESKREVPLVAQELSKFIRQSNQNPSLITIVGHSLGAHVAAMASRLLNSSIGQIIGLDPAFPLFGKRTKPKRFQHTDAIVVHAIHTSGGTLGLLSAVGQADFYPDGGLPLSQPGCKSTNIISDIICAHSRAYKLYAESIRSGGFVGRTCSSIVKLDSECLNRSTAYMGQLELDKQASGIYFLHTSKDPPYALGLN